MAILANYLLVDHHTGSLDRQRGDARMDLPHPLGTTPPIPMRKASSKPPSDISKIQIISNHGYFFVGGSDALLPDAAFTFVLATALTLAHRLF